MYVQQFLLSAGEILITSRQFEVCPVHTLVVVAFQSVVPHIPSAETNSCHDWTAINTPEIKVRNNTDKSSITQKTNTISVSITCEPFTCTTTAGEPALQVTVEAAARHSSFKASGWKDTAAGTISE